MFKMFVDEFEKDGMEELWESSEWEEDCGYDQMSCKC